ncbi:MAG TPA: PAS domain-containing sensor histidine kinase [Polyangiaceae bacterium]|nr:PAS domain-containing sensor histidine kinase [Polyangiaceae bacterium]
MFPVKPDEGATSTPQPAREAWPDVRVAPDESKRELLVISDSLPVLVSLVDRRERYQFVNATYRKWFGKNPADIIGKTLVEVLGPEAYSAIQPYVAEALAGRVATYDGKLKYASGGERHVHATYTPYLVDGRVEGYVALVADVSERAAREGERQVLLLRERRARQAAERSAERLRYVVECSPSAVAMLDRDMRYLFVSKRWVSDFRLDASTEELRGRSHYELFPEIPPHWKEIHRRCLAGETAKNDGEAFVRADGTVNWVRWEVRPWFDDRGTIGGLIIFSEDISAQKKYEAVLRGAIAARDEFLSIASHELRTPLTALVLQLSALGKLLDRESADDQHKVRGKLEMALRQSRRLAHLVNGLLDVSRISAEAVELNLETFDLAVLVREVTSRLEDEATRAGCSFRVEAPAAARGNWDRAQLEQVLANLLGNALKYGSGNLVEVGLRQDAEHVRLTVHDRGIGIAPEDLERIFGRFERAVPSKHYGGLGLGLYISRQIVEAHGGTIEADSSSSAGTTFIVSLPRFADRRSPPVADSENDA